MLTPCEPWDAVWACDVDCLSPTVTGTAVQVATEVLWALSGRQFGYCTETIRSCKTGCPDGIGTIGNWTAFTGDFTYPLPALIGGLWFNLGCGTCIDSCSCTSLEQIRLPWHVEEIIEIKIDGTPLVTGAYRVDNGDLLIRTDGGAWPTCNDLSLPDTEPGTFSVTAKFGNPVPQSGKLAVGELACELAKSLNNEACRLPRAVQTLARQGVTINYANIVELMEKGVTGLYLADLFIGTFNPNRLMQPPKIFSIDQPAPRIQTWP